jgi:hypothetical protein
MPFKSNKNVHIIDGGTVYHVRPHLAISAPAYGKAAKEIEQLVISHGVKPILHLTKMAGGHNLETNLNVSNLVDKLIEDPKTSCIFMPVALCDYEGFVGSNTEEHGKRGVRLKTSDGPTEMALHPADKIIGKIRKNRKDIFLVAFKTTCGATEDEQFLAGLSLMKKNSCNLVLANDLETRLNMVITPEQAKYSVTTNRLEALDILVEMAEARTGLNFTRSEVVLSDSVSWSSDNVPASLRTVVNDCIKNGAYRPFQGKTVGHFAVKTGENEFLTSIRKSNFNDLENTGLVRVEAVGSDKVIAYGKRPSVGGQSQRIIFSAHPDLDCIVHAHVPLRHDAIDIIPVADQWPYECGSHECGENTSRNLKKFGDIYAVMLDNHGPNIVFNRSVDPEKVIEFIHNNFDLSKSTDGTLYKVSTQI